MKILFPLCFILLLGGCASAPSANPTAPVSSVATLKGDAAASLENHMGDEIHCQLQSIDGETAGDTYQLRPGRHSLLINLTIQGRTHVGVVQLMIPDARTYRITARRKDDAVTVSLLDESARIAATSTAPLGEQMNFKVFVVQK